MNAAEVLRPPWLASARSSRWLALFVLVALAVVEFFVLDMAHGRTRALVVGLVWCGALAPWWLLVVPNALWLARDATALSLPRIRRCANASVFVHALLTAAIPALVFSAIFDHPLVWCVGFALAVSGCLLFMLLPGVVWVPIWAAIIATESLHWIHLKAPTPDRLALYAVLPALAMIGLAAWQWSRMLKIRAPTGAGLGRPLMWNLRAQTERGFFGGLSRNADATLARNARAWFTPAPDLRHVGPAHPVRTIRVALGRNSMPKSVASMLRNATFSLVWMTLCITPSILQITQDGAVHSMRALLSSAIGLSLIVTMAAILPAIAIGAYGWRMQLRWTAANNELPLLSLLPQLGDLVAVRRSVALAALVNAFYIATFEWILLCAAGFWTHSPGDAILFATLCSATTVTMTAAVMLHTLAGRPLRGLLIGALAFLTAIVSALATARMVTGTRIDAAINPLIGIALVVLLALSIALAYDGWRVLQRRPHPFLANAK